MTGTHGLCDYCAKLKRIGSDGLIERHFTRIPSNVRNTTRHRKVRRLCQGSGRPPRPPVGGATP